MHSKGLVILAIAGTAFLNAQDDPPGQVARLNHISWLGFL